MHCLEYSSRESSRKLYRRKLCMTFPDEYNGITAYLLGRISNSECVIHPSNRITSWTFTVMLTAVSDAGCCCCIAQIIDRHSSAKPRTTTTPVINKSFPSSAHIARASLHTRYTQIRKHSHKHTHEHTRVSTHSTIRAISHSRRAPAANEIVCTFHTCASDTCEHARTESAHAERSTIAFSASESRRHCAGVPEQSMSAKDRRADNRLPSR